MSPRDNEIVHFLIAQGWGTAVRRPLAGDASFRRYERLEKDGSSAVLMDAPPPQEDVRPFWALADYLRACGFSAPKLLGAEAERGFLLLEDLGDQTFSRTFTADPASETELYGAAVDLLVQLQRLEPPAVLPFSGDGQHQLKPYDEEPLFAELHLLPEWYLPQVFKRTDPQWKPELEAIWRPHFEEITAAPRVLVLRDYHADNLIWLDQRPGLEKVGLLDFQDGLCGHPAYDLVSLLQDARRDLSPGLEAAMKERYLAAVAAAAGPWRPDPKTFERHYQLLGAQRNSKIIGIFTRLWRRDGKPQYLNLIPRVWAHLERNIAHPALAQYRSWLDQLVAGDMRRDVPEMGDRHDH